MNDLAYTQPARRRPFGPLVAGLGVMVAALAAGTTAQAQSSNPPAIIYPATYVDLQNITGVSGITNPGCSGSDDCLTSAVTLPFTFTHYGQSKTSVRISTNGWLTFDTSQSSNDLSNDGIPNTRSPNDLIAYAWDDLVNSQLRVGTVGSSPNRIWIMEAVYRGFGGSSTGLAKAQVWLYEADNAIELRYDNGSNLSGRSFTASIGIEDANGSTGIALSCSPSCSQSNISSLDGQVLRFGSIPGTELSVAVGAFPRGAFPGQTATGTITADNIGQTAGSNVLVNMYLSSNDTLEASDTLVGTATIASVPNGTTTATVGVTVPSGFAAGDYFLIAEIDPNDSITELVENNNVDVAQQMFATAYDLVGAGCRVTNAQGVNPGDTVNFEVDLVNNGVPYAGTVPVQLVASTDRTFDASDTVMGSAPMAFSGANQETGSGSFTLTAGTLSPGTYTPICVIDPNGTLTEASTANNIAVGDDAFGVGPDFAVGEITMPAQVNPGSAVNVSTTLTNSAVPFTGTVEYQLYLSSDDTLDTTQDISLGSFNASMNGEASLADVQSVTFRSSIRGGRYRIIAVVDPNGLVAEVDEMNNTGVSATDIVNAIDFVGRRATVSPSQVIARDTMTVTGEAESTGLAYVGNVAVGVYFSNDQTFDGADYEAYRGLIFFPGNTTGSINVTFPAPAVPPGTYYVMVVPNPNNNPMEADRTNNAAIASTQVTVLGADLRAESISAPDIAFIGREMEIDLEIRNESTDADANGFKYAYYLSDNDLIRVTDRQIFVSPTSSIAAGQSQSFTDRVQIPSSYTSTQALYVGVIVDIFSDVPETSESNNVRRKPTPISVVFPIPDLEGQVVDTATAAAAGENLAVTRLILNTGVADAATFNYTYYLSTNPAISDDDIPLGTKQLALAVNSDDYAIDILDLPPNIAAGSYYVGFLLDPNDDVEEVYEDNNSVVGPALTIYEAAIRFTTEELKNATVGVLYEEGLYAVGGSQPITFSISEGSLPEGISLDADSGLLSGTPAPDSDGLYEFTVRASSGTAFAERDFEIRVTSPTVPLTIATETLRSAISGRPYTGARLVAVGGVPPYQWTVVNGEVSGLELSEDGTISGTPLTPGQYDLTVRVLDDVGGSASASVRINVVSPGNAIQIQRLPLPNAFVGEAYCTADNPFLFAAINTIGEVAWSATNGLPDGMTLSPEGELCGTPTTAGTYDISVRVQDSTGLFDTGLFRLEVLGNDACGVATVTLARAMEEMEYMTEAGGPVQLVSSDACSDPVVWSTVEGAGQLPPGITLSEDGLLSGTPGADTAGAYAFVAQLVDSTNTVSLQPLSIIVDAPPMETVTEDEGCSCTTPVDGERSMAWLALLPGLALVLGRRRRR